MRTRRKRNQRKRSRGREEGKRRRGERELRSRGTPGFEKKINKINNNKNKSKI